MTRFRFLIEDIDELAKRNDLDKLTIGEVPYKQRDAVLSSYLSLFQYMIGNLDWAATSGPDHNRSCHNTRHRCPVKAIIPKHVGPYDFDFSGLVNAPYAVPPDGLRVRKVTQRLYRGFFVHNDSLPLSVATFNEKKSAIMTLFRDDPHLDNRSRDSAIKFLEGFYKVINNPKAFKHEIIDKWLKKSSLGILPSLPDHPIVYGKEDGFPGNQLTFLGNPPGMQIYIGGLRIREGRIGFNLLVNNIFRGGAAGSVANAEYFKTTYES